MRFSISVPVDQQAAYLPTALESIKAQREAVELAVLDASPDDAVQRVLAGYKTMVRHTYHRPDAGQAAAIQEGWDRTAGDIVAWLNADDYYFPEALARVAEVFRSHPDIDVVYGHGVYVSADGDFQMYFPAIDPDIAAITRGCVVCQPACFVRRRAIERVGGLNTALHYAMDWDLWLRLYRAGCAFWFLDQPLAVVRVYPETKTLSGSRRRYREINRVLTAVRTAWWRRSVILMRFRLYDLRHRRNASLQMLERLALVFLARARAVVGRRTRTAVNGLECWTNRVGGECVIELPWYAAELPGVVTVTTDRPIDLSLTVNGTKRDVDNQGVEETHFLGERWRGVKYRARLPQSPAKQLSFRLSAPGSAWRLLGLKLR